MAYTFTTAQLPATGAIAMYTLKTALKAAGWTVKKSSDGTTYNSTGDQITTGASGAGGLANSKAWFVIEMPSSTRQICIQRTAANTTYRIKYSGAAGFTGGSPGATQTPSATDEIVVLGSGTDASPTGGSTFTTDNTYRMNFAVGESAEGYSFYMICNTTGSTTLTSMMLFDVMLTGSYSPSDTDPYVIYVAAHGAPLSILQNTYTGAAKAYLGTVSTANGVSVGLPVYGASAGVTAFPGGVGVSPWTSKDVLVPQIWMRGATSVAPVGFKGFSTLIYAGSVTRTNLDTLDTTSTKDKIHCNGYWLPWNGSIPTL